MKNIKKIGILHGMEETFPAAFVSRVNEIAKREGIPVEAEHVLVDIVSQGVPTDYAVIIDRISQDVPFYRAYLKNAAACGTAVINNPFWWSDQLTPLKDLSKILAFHCPGIKYSIILVSQLT